MRFEAERMTVDDATMKCGLLMESAQAHQKLAEANLEKLRVHTRDLDMVVRGEIRRTMIEELQMLTAESKRAAEVLRGIGRGAILRSALWSIAVVLLCTSIPIAIMRWTLPSESDIASLRMRRDKMMLSVAALERQGGRVEWRRCGEKARLCVRVDRKAPPYGDRADYYIVEGY
jgi:hypothetical protein